jgi:hypothetical protein
MTPNHASAHRTDWSHGESEESPNDKGQPMPSPYNVAAKPIFLK